LVSFLTNLYIMNLLHVAILRQLVKKKRFDHFITFMNDIISEFRKLKTFARKINISLTTADVISKKAVRFIALPYRIWSNTALMQWWWNKNQWQLEQWLAVQRQWRSSQRGWQMESMSSYNQSVCPPISLSGDTCLHISCGPSSASFLIMLT